MQRLGAALSGLLIASALAVPATTATEQSVPSGQSTPSQEGESSLLLIMDASSSMLEEDVPDGRRIDAARSALHDMVADLPDDLPVGMRVFGANEDDTNQEVGCTDTELVLPVEPLDRDAIGEQIDGIQPRGFTPIAESLQQAANDLPDSGERTIVLVSDGIDTCPPPPPCEVAENLVADGIDVTVQSVGFALEDEPDAAEDLQCVAEATGGEYREAGDAAELTDALTQLSARAAQGYQSDAEPVQGAPAFRDAPTLNHGTIYSDTIVQGEGRWYAYDLAQGQTLTSVEVVHPGGAEEGSSAAIALYDDEQDQVNRSSDSVEAGPSTSATSASPQYEITTPTGPGTFYIEIADDGELESGTELAYELEVRVADASGGSTGQPTGQPTEEPTDGSTAEPTSEPTGAVGDDGQAAAQEQDSGGGIWVVLTVLLAVVVLGLAAVLLVVLRRGAQRG